MAHVSDIKLIRTDTTLDLSQKAEKGMICTITGSVFYSARWCSCPARFPMWDNPQIFPLQLQRCLLAQQWNFTRHHHECFELNGLFLNHFT